MDTMSEAFFPSFQPYDALWRYEDLMLGTVYAPVTVLGSPNRNEELLCRVHTKRRFGSLRRQSDIMLPLTEIVGRDDDCSTVLII